MGSAPNSINSSGKQLKPFLYKQQLLFCTFTPEGKAKSAEQPELGGSARHLLVDGAELLRDPGIPCTLPSHC